MEEKELDYAISLIDYDFGFNFINDDHLRTICDFACLGNLKAQLWINEKIIKYDMPIDLKKCICAEDKETLFRKIRAYQLENCEKMAFEKSFSFLMKKIIHVYVELRKRYFREHNKQQSLILTAIIFGKLFLYVDENFKPDADFQEGLSELPTFLMWVYSGDFFYKSRPYSLTNYPNTKMEYKDDSNSLFKWCEYKDDSDIITRLCFALFIIYRDWKLHVTDDTLVMAPIYGYGNISKIVRKELEDLSMFDTFDGYLIIDAFLATENNDISWINEFRENCFFLDKVGGIENLMKTMISSFNFRLYSTLFDFLFKEEFNVNLNDLYNNEIVVRNLLSICYQYLENNGPVVEDVCGWQNLPIGFFEKDQIKGIYIEFSGYELAESLSKCVCIVFDGTKKAYYSADCLESGKNFLIRCKKTDGICISTNMLLPGYFEPQDFFESVLEHFQKL